MTETTDVASQLRDIKQQLRGMMNGVVSASMRAKGLTYRVNFGVELPRLQAFAADLPHTYSLAAALWKEDIRECRILAGILMPTDAFDAELAEVWIDQMRFAEEAQVTSMNLFAREPWASVKVFEWIASENEMRQVCGYLVLSRLFKQGMFPSKRDAQEFVDQAQSALSGTSMPVKMAAQKALVRYEEITGNSTEY